MIGEDPRVSLGSFVMYVWVDTYVYDRILVLYMCVGLVTLGKFLGQAHIGVEGSLGPYYRKHRIYM